MKIFGILLGTGLVISIIGEISTFYNRHTNINREFVDPLVELKPSTILELNSFNSWDPFKYSGLGYLESEIPFKSCVNRSCRITFNEGGRVLDFLEAARRVKNTHYVVVIDGGCFSACTGFADIVHDNVCITSKAQFSYHADSGERIPLFYSDWTLKWIKNHGGFPSNLSGDTINMTFEDARHHWRVCSKKEEKDAVKVIE